MIEQGPRLAHFEAGDEVRCTLDDGTRITGVIARLNLTTATVQRGQERWRVPYRFIDSAGGERHKGRHKRLFEVDRAARSKP